MQKPPIVEVWVEFQLDPSESTPSWDLDVAKTFLERFSDSFVHTEVLNEQQLQITPLPTGDRRESAGEVRLEVKLLRIRTRDADGTRWLQLGEDVFAYNIVKKGTAYPGFDTLCDAAWKKFEAYVEHFQPKCVRKLRLHYMDRVDIPRPTDKEFDLDDFFQIGVKHPYVDLGALNRFAIQVAFDCGHTDDELSMTFRSEPQSGDNRAYRFIMDWEATSANVGSLSRDDIMERLRKAHVRISECFEASFTPTAWELFEPR